MMSGNGSDQLAEEGVPLAARPARASRPLAVEGGGGGGAKPGDGAKPGAVRITDLPLDQRPREKARQRGIAALTDAELIGLLVRTGTVGKNAVQIGQEMLEKCGGLTGLSRQARQDWKGLIRQFKGIGVVKGQHLEAALEIGRRIKLEEFDQKRLDSPAAVFALMGEEMRTLATERLRIILLNAKMRRTAMEELAIGTVDSIATSVRDTLRPVIVQQAYGFLLAHNHPSGDPTPSTADRLFTSNLKAAARVLGVNFVDHVIIGHPVSEHPAGYFSFREAGLLD